MPYGFKEKGVYSFYSYHSDMSGSTQSTLAQSGSSVSNSQPGPWKTQKGHKYYSKANNEEKHNTVVTTIVALQSGENRLILSFSVFEKFNFF